MMLMLRAAAYLAVLSLIAYGAAFVASSPGSVVVEWGGRRLRTSPVFLVVCALGSVAASLLAMRLLQAIQAAPRRLRDHFRRRRQGEVLSVLTSGFVGVFAEDDRLAERQSRRLRRLLPGHPLASLLAERAAALRGRHFEARDYYREMVKDRRLAALGHRGLYDLARQSCNLEDARKHIEAVLASMPETLWALEARFDLALAAENWNEALEFLERASSCGALDAAQASWQRARLMTLDAWFHPERSGARKRAEQAARLDPDCVAAVTAAARLAAREEMFSRAVKLIEDAWRRRPHPVLAYVYARLRRGDSDNERRRRLDRLLHLSQGGALARAALIRAASALDAPDWALSCSRGDGMSASFFSLAGLAAAAWAKRRLTETGDEAAVDWLIEMTPSSSLKALEGEDGMGSSSARPVFGSVFGRDFHRVIEKLDEALLRLPPLSPGFQALSAPPQAAPDDDRKEDSSVDETDRGPLPIWDPRIQGAEAVEKDDLVFKEKTSRSRDD